MAKAKDTIKDISLCEGVKLSKSIYENKENRLLTLLIKGAVVYLLTMGSIGFYLSSFSIEYNEAICHVVIFLMAIFSAMLYYRLLTENLGYMIVLVVFCLMVYSFRTYINSGFYAIVNITTDGAAQYFNIDIQKVYNEQVANRYVSVTFAVLFIGIVLDILLNVYISRRMQYVTAIFLIMGLNMVPLYMVFEPNNFYVIMVLGGIALAYVYRSGRHYSPQVSVKRDDIKFKEKRKKREIAYVYDAKAMANAGVIALVFIIIIVPVLTAIKPKESFNVGYKENEYKKLSMAAVSTILMDGISSFFKMSKDVGGLEGGKLGAVSTIRLDYQTDLVVQFTPYTDDRIYLKGFTGVRYNPYANVWTSIKEVKNYNDELTPEANTLRDAYLEDYKYSSQAIIKIDNVENDAIYKPYYCYEITKDKRYTDMLCYPRLDNNNVYVKGEYYEGMPYTEADLYVPPENIEAVEKIIDELNDPLTNEQIVQSVIDYYQENIPYTIKPGKTPYKEDFVNNFLLEKKKGYCSHYASAAVLIYRHLGVPARYVEGYAIDYEQIYNADLIDEAKYSDYYKGYSELGETALVSVKVTDADAHAWVEVYDRQKGWYPVEVTPYATIQEEEAEDFWSMFEDMMDDTGGGQNVAIQNAFDDGGLVNKAIKNILKGLGILLFVVLVVLLSIKLGDWIRFLIIFSKADINDKLIYKYQRICRKYRKKDKIFRDKINYRQQVDYLQELKKDENNEAVRIPQDQIIGILERAGFSEEIISNEEYQLAINWLKSVI